MKGIFLVLVVSVACAAPFTALAQLQPPPQRAPSVTVPTTPQNEAVMRSLEAQRSAFQAYQACVAEHRREYDLHQVANEVIRLRDNRAGMEFAMKQEPERAKQYPGGIDQLIAARFAHYRSLGGTAASISEVKPIATPCEPPNRLGNPQRSDAPVLLRDSRSVPTGK